MNVLLVIDLQKQFMDENREYENILNFYKNNKKNYDVVLLTLFKNIPEINPNYVEYLNWSDCKEASVEDLLIQQDEKENILFEVKSGYSSEEIFKIASSDDHIDIVGCDSDACVLATAFKLWDRGYNFRILSDYIYTTADEFDNETVLELLKRNFGNCII